MSVNPDCIFCKIAAGQIPALCVFEDEGTFAFLDIHPLAEGHLLVIPRSHYERLDQMSSDAVEAVTRHLPRLAAAVVSATDAGGYNILQNNGAVSGQAVNHVHFHIIPRRKGDGLGYRWNAGEYEPGRDQELHGRLRAALE